MVEEKISESREKYNEKNYCKQYVKDLIEPNFVNDSQIEVYYSSKALELCDRVKMLSDEAEGWAIIQNDEIEVSRKNIEGEPMIGRARINFGKTFNMEEIVSYLWDSESKLEYDNQLVASVLLKDFSNGLHILYQAFKGQWGFVGRDFVLYCWKQEYSSERVIIACSSVDEWPCKDENIMLKNLVRGKTIVAGYDISLKSDGDIVLTYIFQANLQVANLPLWIMNKIVTDHLYVVKNVSNCLRKKYNKCVEDEN